MTIIFISDTSHHIFNRHNDIQLSPKQLTQIIVSSIDIATFNLAPNSTPLIPVILHHHAHDVHPLPSSHVTTPSSPLAPVTPRNHAHDAHHLPKLRSQALAPDALHSYAPTPLSPIFSAHIVSVPVPTLTKPTTSLELIN